MLGELFLEANRAGDLLLSYLGCLDWEHPIVVVDGEEFIGTVGREVVVGL